MTGEAETTTSESRGWKITGWICRILVGGLFIYAAQSKIIDPMKFVEEVRAYELAPLIVTNLIAIVLPWIELFAAVLLIIGIWKVEARFLIFLMLLAFTFGKISVEVRGMDINCGCWGSDWMEETFHGIRGIALNLVMVGMLVLDYYSQRRPATVAAAD